VRKVEVKSPKGVVVYNELYPSDIWRMHRKGELPEFLATAWIRNGMRNPILARLTWLYHQAIVLTLTAIAVVGCPLIMFGQFDGLKIVVIPSLVLTGVVAFCVAASRRIGFVRSCSDAYAESVCHLFNTLNRSLANVGKAISFNPNVSASAMKGFIEAWLIGLLVESHKCQEMAEVKGPSFEARLAHMNQADKKKFECQGIANSAHPFGLANLNLTEYHHEADRLIAAEKAKAEGLIGEKL